MSIKTIDRCGFELTSWIASVPVVAVKTFIPRRSSTLLSAKTLRASSSTRTTVRPASCSSESRSRSSMRCLSVGSLASARCRNNAVSSSRRSGNSTPLTTMLRAIACSWASSSAESSRPVKTTTGKSAKAGSAPTSFSRSKPEMSGSRRSKTAQSNGSERSRSHALRAGGRGDDFDVVVARAVP